MSLPTAVAAADEALFMTLNHLFASPFMDALMATVTVAGESLFWGPVAAAAIYAGDRERWRQRLIALLVTLAVAGVGVSLLKDAFERDRPFARFKAQIDTREVTVRMPHLTLETRSFPSGHTQAAFTGATFFLLTYRRRWGWWLMGMAALVGSSRIYLGVHFPFDVLGGALYGSGMAWLIWRLNPYEREPRESATQT